MKKIYYILAICATFLASCKPLDGTYKALDAMPTNSLSFTLNSADYGLLTKTIYSTAYPATKFLFDNTTDANLYIPYILTAKYPSTADGVRATVGFTDNPAASTIKAPDALVSHISLTLATADYNYAATTVNGVPIAANSNPYLTSSTVIDFLNVKYPTPALYQMVLLTYTFNDGVVNALTTDTFIYFKAGWTKVYTVSPDQYSSAGRGVNNFFDTNDAANLAILFNQFLTQDPNVAATAKAGDIKYVSYKYATSATVINQNILALTYNGTKWVTQLSLLYLKQNGAWIPDPTIYLTFPIIKNTEYAFLNNTANLNIGTAAARTNLISFGDFNLGTGTTGWVDADVTLVIQAGLVYYVTNPIVGNPYTVTYYAFVSPSTVARTKTFIWDGSTFVYQGY